MNKILVLRCGGYPLAGQKSKTKHPWRNAWCCGVVGSLRRVTPSKNKQKWRKHLVFRAPHRLVGEVFPKNKAVVSKQCVRALHCFAVCVGEGNVFLNKKQRHDLSKGIP